MRCGDDRVFWQKRNEVVNSNLVFVSVRDFSAVMYAVLLQTATEDP